MEAASGLHFSGLRLDGLRSSSNSPRAAPSFPIHTSSPKALADFNASKQPFVIGVSGGTASGKTTVCDMIIQQLHDHHVVLVNQDSFYRGLTPEESEHVHEYNFDHPAFDTEQLLECVEKLQLGQSVHVPIYDCKKYRRSSDSFRQLKGGVNGYNFKSVKRWTTQRKLGYCLIECDKIFVPIHKETHWCLTVINKKDEKFQYLDSLKGMGNQVMKILMAINDAAKDWGTKMSSL